MSSHCPRCGSENIVTITMPAGWYQCLDCNSKFRTPIIIEVATEEGAE